MFAANNTYGLKIVDQKDLDYMQYALSWEYGCKQQIRLCRSINFPSPSVNVICQEAADMCNDNVMGKSTLKVVSAYSTSAH
jgi:carboxypeptidase D